MTDPYASGHDQQPDFFPAPAVAAPEPPAYDWAMLHGDPVAAIEPPSAEEIAASRERRDREAWGRAEAAETPSLHVLDESPDPRDEPGFEPGDVDLGRVAALEDAAPVLSAAGPVAPAESDPDVAGPGEPRRGWRTLEDIDDAAPGPLIFGMLEDGPNLLYAAPGAGKGSTGAFLGVEAQRVGMLPMVFDAERRPREWARRVSGLGGDRSRFIYVVPEDLGPKMAGRPLWEQITPIREICAQSGADILFVDSILPAVGVGEERLRSDAQAPFLFVAALDSLRIPSVSFGHPPKGQPEGEPFGSMAWVAAMRMTWMGAKAEGEDHRVRWRPRKRNERGSIPGVLMTFSYADDGRLCEVTREDDEESTREWLLSALVGGSRSVADMAEELLEDEEAHVTDDMRVRAKERLGRTLRRMAKDGAVQREGPRTGPKVKWGLRWQA